MTRTPHVLIIDNSVDHQVYRPVEHWTRHLEVPWSTVRAVTGDWESPLLEASHVIVTGSEASICAEEPWIEQACQQVRMLAKRNTPILASCFGHQMVARALLGRLQVRPTPTPEFGWIDLTLSVHARTDSLFGGFDSELSLYSAHFDEVHPLPEGWTRLASSPKCENAVVRVANRPIWGIQHHPEIGIDEGRKLLDDFLDRYPEKAKTIRGNLQNTPKDSQIPGELIARFLTVVG